MWQDDDVAAARRVRKDAAQGQMMRSMSTVQSQHDPGPPRLTFWGVRGSHPVPGERSVRYGGNTACIEVRSGGRFIIDAGTGIIDLGRVYGGPADEPIHILLTHLHHDHVQGLPFFKPIYERGREVHLWCGNLGGESAEAALTRMFSAPLFPMQLQSLPARVVFHGFHAGETIVAGGEAVRTAPLKHPSGATGYRFDHAGGSAAVITDIEHEADQPDPAVVALCEGVETLVYDTMIEECDFGSCKGWGHSTITAGLRLADAVGARRFVGFHHSPLHDDAMLDARAGRLERLRPGSLLAREGQSLVCGREARVRKLRAGAAQPEAVSL
jgi:phosphoribosyl 1,2-cyclic phosphodiesterase